MTSFLSVRKLADRAASYMRTGQATSYPSAARMAVLAEGITHEPDVNRLVSDICAELGKRGAQRRQRNASRAKIGIPPKKNPPPRQLLLPLTGGKMH